MRVLFSPIRSDEKLCYEIQEGIIVAHHNEAQDIFDFSGLTDGMLDSVETSLPVNPIISAERVEGTLHVVLLYYCGEHATHEEKYPEWKEHSELKVGVYHG